MRRWVCCVILQLLVMYCTAQEGKLDTVVRRLDNLYLTLNNINDFQNKDLDTTKARKQLHDITVTLRLIRQDLEDDVIPEYKKLLLYQNMLNNIKLQLLDQRTALFRYNNDLVRVNSEIQSFTHDSILRSMISDSLYRVMYLEELSSLREKWDSAQKVTGQSLKEVNALQAAISAPYFLTVDLLSTTDRMKKEIAGRLFYKEYGYIWDREGDRGPGMGTGELTSRSFRAQRGMMDYFLGREWGYYIYALLIGALFWVWTRRNLRRIKERPDHQKLLGDLRLTYLLPMPILSTLVVILNVLPFFNINTPTLFTQLGQLLLLIVVSVLFWLHWPRRYFKFWGILIILYILFLVTGTVLVPRREIRLWLLLLNAGSIVLAWRCVHYITQFFSYRRIVNMGWWLYLVLNGVAIICNMLGRLTLAKIASSSAIFGLVQIVVLCVFVDSILEALRLQTAASRLDEKKEQVTMLFERMQKGLERLLLLFVGLTWLVAFSINLNVYDIFYEWIVRAMGHVVKIGSLSFRIGNVLLFILIVYCSNLLQKYIGYLYRSPEGKTAPQTGHRGSRLAMIRLVMIIGGFLLAIAASGLPVDRITIVLGALGVGIGLGLQNIVNNLVSGVILVFERPFQIGDYIELNGKKGIVRDIGIRSSRMVTETGTEIIMPNGDLLAGEVINWTIRNNQVRIEVPMTVEAASFETVVAVVQEALAGHSDLSGDEKPSVLLNTATEKTTSFTVLVWVSNISQIQTIKSQVLGLLYQKFREKGIKTV